jgi:hypothetical protein
MHMILVYGTISIVGGIMTYVQDVFNINFSHNMRYDP